MARSSARDKCILTRSDNNCGARICMRVSKVELTSCPLASLFHRHRTVFSTFNLIDMLLSRKDSVEASSSSCSGPTYVSGWNGLESSFTKFGMRKTQCCRKRNASANEISQCKKEGRERRCEEDKTNESRLRCERNLHYRPRISGSVCLVWRHWPRAPVRL